MGVVGRFDKDFLFELQEKSASVKPVRDANAFDLVFFAIARLDEFDRLAKLRRGMEDNGAIWTVYPKGTGKFPDAAVFEKGRASGLKDNKVMSFSETHTALRWVIPVSERGKRK
ncbi:MAG TPA: hypothetical protein DEH78_16665 [Solibacterales bacterium]|nr:hypothetical protein [Bryobacterales bacterium]